MNTRLGPLARSSLSALALAVVGGCSASSPEPNGGTGGSPGPTVGGSAGTPSAPVAGTSGVPTAGSSPGAGGASFGGSAPGAAGTPATPMAGTPSAGGTAPIAGTSAGGSAGTAGGAAPSGGTGGEPPVQKLCATKTTVLTPLIVDFEGYDGMKTADMWGFYFGGATAGMFGADAALGGFYRYAGNDAAAMMTIAAGHDSNFGLNFTVTGENVWGGGVGTWLKPTCLNASSFKGISFWIRGETAQNLFSVTLEMDSTTLPLATDPAGGGTCAGTMDTCKGPTKADIPLSVDWTQVSILWADFAPGTAGTTPVTATGDNVTGISFRFSLPYVEAMPATTPPTYVPVPGDITAAIDDISFVP